MFMTRQVFSRMLLLNVKDMTETLRIIYNISFGIVTYSDFAMAFNTGQSQIHYNIYICYYDNMLRMKEYLKNGSLHA